jgi:hypothetical protein
MSSTSGISSNGTNFQNLEVGKTEGKNASNAGSLGQVKGEAETTAKNEMIASEATGESKVKPRGEENVQRTVNLYIKDLDLTKSDIAKLTPGQQTQIVENIKTFVKGFQSILDRLGNALEKASVGLKSLPNFSPAILESMSLICSLGSDVLKFLSRSIETCLEEGSFKDKIRDKISKFFDIVEKKAVESLNQDSLSGDVLKILSGLIEICLEEGSLRDKIGKLFDTIKEKVMGSSNQEADTGIEAAETEKIVDLIRTAKNEVLELYDKLVIRVHDIIHGNAENLGALAN